MLLAVATASAQCAAPDVKSAKSSKDTYTVTINYPGGIGGYDVLWTKMPSGENVLVPCQGQRKFTPHSDVWEIAITNQLAPGSPFYGIKDGDQIKIRAHCTVPANCYTDTNVGTFTVQYTVKFK